MDVLGILVGVGCLPVIWKRLPLSLALYGTGMVLLPLATGALLSFARFISVSIPHMLALAIILEKRPELRNAVLVTFLILQTLVAKGLMGWYLVG